MRFCMTYHIFNGHRLVIRHDVFKGLQEILLEFEMGELFDL